VTGEVVIRAEGLSKRFVIEQRQAAYGTLGDRFSELWQRSTGWLRKSRTYVERREFWALRDVSFEVSRGEVVGILGRNGAGKSTLFKILSRITAPTRGRAEVNGRLGSLLEVGTGFHPELTGRENIYLNGAILGMKKADIDRKFDEIVDFAEIPQFLDLPIKRYSSGMYLRLAFAVAAHLEPDILLVDEVLAVGDAEFQKKCIGKMHDLSTGSGRTVLFVSHNVEAVRQLCSRCLLLDHGMVLADGDVDDTLRRYASASVLRAPPDAWIDLAALTHVGTGEARFSAVRYRGGEDSPNGALYPGEPVEFLLRIESDAPRTVGHLAVRLSDAFHLLVNTDSAISGRSVHLERGSNLVRVRIEALHLNPGKYSVGLWLADPLVFRTVGFAFDYLERAFEIEVLPRPDARGIDLFSSPVSCEVGIEEVRPVPAEERPIG